MAVREVYKSKIYYVEPTGSDVNVLRENWIDNTINTMVSSGWEFVSITTINSSIILLFKKYMQ